MARRSYTDSFLYNFPTRKFFGTLFGTVGGIFSIAFLCRALIGWGDIPDGVLGLVGILTGGFGAYVASSSYEHKVDVSEHYVSSPEGTE